ncbi:MAG TPA: response regulator transcription factor [Acidimicrobiales bacterium]|jgi:two-component system response regulator DesR|nr:response regulator transcription factor [Acidimicrobiales bacterium]
MADDDIIDLRDDPIRIVLADDNGEIRYLLRTWLEIEGRFEVMGEAERGDELVDLVELQRPDEVVVDLAMPEMDGLAAIIEIRRRAPDTKILVLSAFASPSVRRKAFALGADAVLTKGVPLEEVESTLLGLSTAGASSR